MLALIRECFSSYKTIVDSVSVYFWELKLLRGELDWAPKMEAYVGDKFELESLWSTMANLFKYRKWAHKTGIRQERKGWKITDDSYAFSNAILEYRKIGITLPKCILFLQNMILNKAVQFISYDNRQILLCF